MMEPEFTEYQTAGEQMRAEEMSRVPTVPPAQVPGYRIERLLGRGAFGQVWVGNDRNTGRTVAIKFYIHHSKMDWQLLSREVRHLVSMAADRNIVQVLAVGWDHEPPYYVMEYLENGSLEDLIRREGRMSLPTALPIFDGILAALKHSHGRGILHCDLKPANILLDSQLNPRIADFGQSRMSDEQSPSLGTLFYMAPEQADLNAMPDARWDVYALGAILYCMLVGEPPYYAANRVTTLRTAKDLSERLEIYRDMIQKAPAPRAHWRAKNIDKELAKIIDKMLTRNNDQRYENVQQVVDALNERAESQMRRPLLLLGGVGPLLLMLVMSVFFWRGVSTAREQSTLRLQQEASRSNGFAAGLAARTMEKDIAGLYQLVESQAARPTIQSKMVETLESLNDDTWHAMAVQKPLPDLYEKLLSSPSRQDLEKFLESLLAELNGSTSVTQDAARLNSIFILDKYGTMIATALDEDLEQTRVGWNFAYRGYFNGDHQDHVAGEDRRTFSPYLYTHLSPPFESTTTGKWKIAISTPIFRSAVENDSAETPDGESVVGVMVVTINLGDFDLLGADVGNSDVGAKEEPADRFAVLVDGRSGEQAGMLVQHPLLGEIADQKASGKDYSASSYRISQEQLQRLRTGSMLNYQDPMAEHPLGSKYSGSWIATLEHIELPVRGTASHEALSAIDHNHELLVLVQEPASKTARPVQQLVESMTREFAIALGVIMAVIGSLWFFGMRMLRMVKN